MKIIGPVVMNLNGVQCFVLLFAPCFLLWDFVPHVVTFTVWWFLVCSRYKIWSLPNTSTKWPNAVHTHSPTLYDETDFVKIWALFKVSEMFTWGYSYVCHWDKCLILWFIVSGLQWVCIIPAAQLFVPLLIKILSLRKKKYYGLSFFILKYR